MDAAPLRGAALLPQTDPSPYLPGLVIEVLSLAYMLLWFSSLVPYFLQKSPSCPTSSSACMAESDSQSARSSPRPGAQGLLAPLGVQVAIGVLPGRVGTIVLVSVNDPLTYGTICTTDL